jgi:hypothetical protein
VPEFAALTPARETHPDFTRVTGTCGLSCPAPTETFTAPAPIFSLTKKNSFRGHKIFCSIFI